MAEIYKLVGSCQRCGLIRTIHATTSPIYMDCSSCGHSMRLDAIGTEFSPARIVITGAPSPTASEPMVLYRPIETLPASNRRARRAAAARARRRS